MNNTAGQHDGGNLEETNMDTTNTEPSKFELFNKIDVRLKKAKAITFLMAYAANEGSLDLGEELIWAQQVANSLIDEALSAARQLADIAKEPS